MKPSQAKRPKASGTQITRRNVTFDNLGFPATPFPLELHAKIAALLLEGDNFEEASERAILLLNICSRRLDEAKHWVAMRTTMEKKFNRLGLYEDSVPFPRALKIITGQKRFDRAESDFLTFLQVKYPKWSKAMLGAVWDGVTRKGFKRERVLTFFAQFAEMRAQGKLGKRKPNRKNSVATKKRP
jgi:hypothetical protein